MSTGAVPSERRCAHRMHLIMQGRRELDGGIYTVGEIAERYDVHRDTVYKGIRAGSPLFPQAGRKGAGPKAWLHFTTESIETSDRNRIAFYKRTPSWHDLFGAGASGAPARRAAKQVIQAPDKAPRRRETD
jgi:hypothetical protein